jgi:hypothetical protein
MNRRRPDERVGPTGKGRGRQDFFWAFAASERRWW